MLLAESETRRKLCPATFSGDLENVDTSCSGPNCMAWRWRFDEDGNKVMKTTKPEAKCFECENGVVRGGAGGTCAECDGEGVIMHWEQVGYCGLAGKPER